jgi:hypothetical protein
MDEYIETLWNTGSCANAAQIFRMRGLLNTHMVGVGRGVTRLWFRVGV